MKSILLLLISSTLFGCASLGPIYSEKDFRINEGMAEIFVFRLSKSVGGAACFETSLDEDTIGILANGGFLRKEITPGKHKIAIAMIRGNDVSIEFEAKESESIYLYFTVAMNSSAKIPKEEIISDGSNFKIESSAVFHFNNSLVRVTPKYAKSLLVNLGDSSEVKTCLSDVRFKN